MTVQAGLCWTWSEIQIVGFLTHRLKYNLRSPSLVSFKFLDSLVDDHDDIEALYLMMLIRK